MDYQHNQLLERAVLSGDIAFLEQVRSQGVENINQLNLQGNNLLHVACIAMDEKNEDSRLITVSALLAFDGIDINRGNLSFGTTPLIYAVNSNSLKMTQLLLASGADINKACNAGLSPLIRSISRRSSMLMGSLQHGSPDAVFDCLMSHAPDIMHTDNEQKNALWHAALNNKFNMFMRLLESGSDYTHERSSRADKDLTVGIVHPIGMVQNQAMAHALIDQARRDGTMKSFIAQIDTLQEVYGANETPRVRKFMEFVIQMRSRLNAFDMNDTLHSRLPSQDTAKPRLKL